MDLTNEQIEKKRREVIAKFNKQFIDNNFSTDAYTHKAVELLTRNVNPYDIIEELITANQELFNEYTRVVSLSSRP
jgi:hypothetical protein